MTNNTRKYLRIGCPSYDIDEEPVSIIAVDNNGTDNILYLGGGTGAGNATTEIRLKTDVLNTTTGTDRVVIKSDGKVGIGTDDPVSLLDVLGTPITGYEERINALFVDSTSYAVGVGGGVGFRGKYNSAGDYETFAAIKGVKANSTNENTEGELHFQTATPTVLATSMMISSGGAVGIGTLNPQAALHVTGFIRSDSLTASMVVVTDANKNLVSSNRTVGELDFLCKTLLATQTLVDGTPTEMFEVSVVSGFTCGGKFSYSIQATSSGSHAQSVTGEVIFNAAYDGLINAGILEGDKLFSGAAGTSMPVEFSIAVSTNKVIISCNANSSLTSPTINITYKLEMHEGTFTEL
jgi:hypothetical protein